MARITQPKDFFFLRICSRIRSLPETITTQNIETYYVQGLRGAHYHYMKNLGYILTTVNTKENFMFLTRLTLFRKNCCSYLLGSECSCRSKSIL